MQNTATANPVLTGHYVKFARDPMGFVAEAIAPTFNTGLQSAQYYVFTKDNMLHVPRNIGRAPGAPHQEVGLMLSDDNYFCENYGIKIPVPDEDRKKYAAFIDADIAAMRRVSDIIKVNRELRVKALATDLATVPNAGILVGWDNPAANPKTDSDVAKEAIRKGIGLRANTMVISESVRLALSQNNAVRAAFQLAINGAVTLDMLKAYFQIENIVVAGTVLATSKEGQALTADDIWGDDVLFAHVEPGQDLMLPNFARTMNWTDVGSVEGQVETWRDADRKSDVHQVDHCTDEKLTSAEAGYLLTNALQA